MAHTELEYIIAIGASAGGLEEINAFFDHTPLDSVSYVIIQHLSPDFKSRMVELLAKHSKLVVKEAENGMMVASNEVYLIPNNKFMTICDNTLFLTYKEKVKGPHLTINRFFNSLAADSGKKAIGVIFSGLGSDGTEGIKSIKKAGGLVIVRNPQTAEFGSMPSNAIATGLADFILEPEEMPEAIEDYVKHQGKLLTDYKEDEKNFDDIVNVIKIHMPFDFSEYKKSTILRRIKRRAAYHNYSNLEDYTSFLTTSPEEIEALTQDFLISVTCFFRDKKAFEFLAKDVLPKIVEKLTPDEELKMWVAGCATGEEAYSLAILAYRQLKDNPNKTVVKIFATDIDNAALTFAGKGVYNDTILKNVSPEWVKNYFIREGNNYRIIPEIRKMVIFAQHDLVKNPPYCNMQMITCRNMLIYMTPVLQKKIFNLLLFGLQTDGYLFLGSSENPTVILQNLEVIDKKFKIYKNTASKRTLRFDAFSLPEYEEIKSKPARFVKENTASNINQTLDEAININLVKELDYLIVCVDEKNQVVKTYGNTTKYLLQKNFNLNLTELLPQPLAIAFNTLSHSVLKTNEKAAISGIKIKQEEAVLSVSLLVNPLQMNKTAQKLLMVTFCEDRAGKPVDQAEIVFDEKIYQNQYTLNLEEELKDLKDKLHLAQEKLDASHENLQSFNEELLSANEEMQSTNEEMQSVNEELHTINTDYQLKNKELLELNDDLNNYFRSNINGQLFINTDLLLMKFSPGAVKLINLIESDIGRPISNITTNIKLETLVDDIKMVLTEDRTITKEIETNNGKWYQVMTMPYLQQPDQKIKGAIMTFNDVTELKITQLELNKTNKVLQRTNEDLNNFVHAASHDLLGPLGNIEGSIAIMNDIKVTDPKLNRFLNIINFSVQKFRMLIKDIATIAKIESDMIAMEPVDIEDIMSNIEWSLENKINLSAAVINKNFEVKHILFSKKNLRSIVYNLISNAIKFKADHPPIINISTTKIGDELKLSVQDNGIGIPADDLDKIFDMYGRLHPDVEGYGIGLYLAKKIINAAGGNITVESEPGNGSTFSIYLKTEQQK